MFRNYLKTAYRNIVRNRTYTIVNLIGLVIGISSFLFILLFIFDELSYDKHYSKHDRIYRVVNVFDKRGVGERSSSCPIPLGPTLSKEYPELIEQSVRIFNFQLPHVLVKCNGKKFNEPGLYYVDSNFFEVFDYEFIKGNKETAFLEKGSVIITESMAKKYYGGIPDLGDSLIVDNLIKLKISAVVKDSRPQSHFHPDFLVNMSTLRRTLTKYNDYWIWNPCWTYIVLKENVKKERVEPIFPVIVNKYMESVKDLSSFYLQPLNEIHLKSDLSYELEKNGNMENLYILLAIGLFILFAACINFMNLSTAFSSSRSKEIGVRKVLGVERKQLIMQFLVESVLICFISMLISLSLIELLNPYFNSFTGKHIIISNLYHIASVIGVVLFCLVLGIIAGIYPALFLTRYNAVMMIYKRLRSRKNDAIGRKILVIFQVAISSIVITITIGAFNQLYFLRNTELGFNKNNIVVLTTSYSNISINTAEFLSELKKNKQIISVTSSDYIPGVNHNIHEFNTDDDDKNWSFYPALLVNNDFLKTFDLKIIAGRDYNHLIDSDFYYSTLISESMANYLGWKPGEALGKSFHSSMKKQKIVGVFKDFHSKSLHVKLEPFVISLWPEMATRYISIRLPEGDHEALIDYIKATWEKFDNDKPFEYKYLSDEIDNQYNDEKILGRIAALLAILTILIASLGLFALTLFLTQFRTKEIGIRKVLGASLFQIIRLLSVDYIWLVIIANLIAFPVSYLVLKRWLSDFAYTTDISMMPYIASFIITLIITILITLFRSIKVSQSNPVKSLRYE